MLLKQKNLVLIFLAQVIICAGGFVIEDGNSPPQTLAAWLPEDGPFEAPFRPQHGQRRNSYTPILEQTQTRNSYTPALEQTQRRNSNTPAREQTQRRNTNTQAREQPSPVYHSPRPSQPPWTMFEDSPMFPQAQRRLRPRTPAKSRESFQHSSPFQNFQNRLRNPNIPNENGPQVRIPFDEHKVIDSRSPISKLEREQDVFWGSDDEGQGFNARGEPDNTRFGGVGPRDGAQQGYKPQSFFGEFFKSSPEQKRRPRKTNTSEEFFLSQQRRTPGNRPEPYKTEGEFFFGGNDFSQEKNPGGYKDEIRYESPFSDHGASNDKVDEHFDFFSNREAFNDNSKFPSLGVDDYHKKNIIPRPDFEAAFASDIDLSKDLRHLRDSPKTSDSPDVTPYNVGVKEESNEYFSNIKTPVRSMEALESQEYGNRKIQTIYRVSRGNDNGSIYPFITSVMTNAREATDPERRTDNSHTSRDEQKLQPPRWQEEQLEPRFSKQNRRGEGVPSEPQHESRPSHPIAQDEDGPKAKEISNNYVPEYIDHQPKQVPITNGIPTFTPAYQEFEPDFITKLAPVHLRGEAHRPNLQSVLQTGEVHPPNLQSVHQTEEAHHPNLASVHQTGEVHQPNPHSVNHPNLQSVHQTEEAYHPNLQSVHQTGEVYHPNPHSVNHPNLQPVHQTEEAYHPNLQSVHQTGEVHQPNPHSGNHPNLQSVHQTEEAYHPNPASVHQAGEVHQPIPHSVNHPSLQAVHQTREVHHPNLQSVVQTGEVHHPNQQSVHQTGEVHHPNLQSVHQTGRVHHPNLQSLLQTGDVYQPNLQSVLQAGDVHHPNLQSLLQTGDVYQPNLQSVHQTGEVHHPNLQSVHQIGDVYQPNLQSVLQTGDVYQPNLQSVLQTGDVYQPNLQSVHQTGEDYHNPELFEVSLQSPPEGFAEVPQLVHGIHDLPQAVDPSYQQPFLEVNIPKNVNVRKVRKNYVYEYHLAEEEHLTDKKNPYNPTSKLY